MRLFMPECLGSKKSSLLLQKNMMYEVWIKIFYFKSEKVNEGTMEKSNRDTKKYKSKCYKNTAMLNLNDVY